jgi:hypothetical protein
VGKRPLSSPAAALALGALLLTPCSRTAGQDDAAEPASTGRPALDVSDAGVLVGGLWGRSASGRSLFGEAGATALGLRSAGKGSWLGLWDARLAGVAGTAAMASPAPTLVGWRGQAQGELGHRFRPGLAWSPYLGAHGLLRLRWLKSSTGGPRRLNQMPGTSGLTGAGALRLGTGISYLDGSRSLLLLVFLQGARRPTDVVAEETFAEVGAAARLDLGDRLAASLEASLGWSGPRRDRALRSSDRTRHEEIDAAIRIGPWRATWIALEGRASRDEDRLAYAGGRTYRTVSEPDLEMGLAIGAWVWR